VLERSEKLAESVEISNWRMRSQANGSEYKTYGTYTTYTTDKLTTHH